MSTLGQAVKGRELEQDQAKCWSLATGSQIQVSDPDLCWPPTPEI